MRDLVAWFNAYYYTPSADIETLDIGGSIRIDEDNGEQASTLWDKLTDNELSAFDATFVNDYERWLEVEVYNADPDKIMDEWSLEHDDILDKISANEDYKGTGESLSWNEESWPDFVEEKL